MSNLQAGGVTAVQLEARLEGVEQHLRTDVLEGFGEQLQQSVLKRLEHSMHSALDKSLVTIQGLVMAEVRNPRQAALSVQRVISCLCATQ